MNGDARASIIVPAVLTPSPPLVRYVWCDEEEYAEVISSTFTLVLGQKFLFSPNSVETAKGP